MIICDLYLNPTISFFFFIIFIYSFSYQWHPTKQNKIKKPKKQRLFFHISCLFVLFNVSLLFTFLSFHPFWSFHSFHSFLSFLTNWPSHLSVLIDLQNLFGGFIIHFYFICSLYIFLSFVQLLLFLFLHFYK